MMFHVVAVGRVRNPSLRAACEDYLERSHRYIKLRMREVPDGARGSKSRTVVLREEAKAILRATPSNARLVALSRSGRQLDSRAFAAALDQWRQNPQDLAFLIGGAYGLGDAVQDRCDDAIRLSDLTLPHELARLVLLEQIYRGNTILKGEPYHKGD